MRDDFEYTEKSRGQSRARGQSHARGAASRSGSRSSAGSHSSGYTGPRSSSSHSSYAGGSRSTAGTGNRSSRSTGNSGRRGSDYGRRSQDGPNMKLVLGAVLAFLIVGGALVFAVRGGFVGGAKESSAAAEETTQNVLYTDTDTIHKDITLDLSAISPEAKSLNLNGMDREAVKQAIHDAYSWKLVVKNANPSIDSFKMPDLSVYDQVKETEARSTSGESDNDGSVQTVAVDNPYASVTIRPEAKSFAIPDLIGEQVDTLVEQIFTDYEAKIAEESASVSAGSETSEEAAESTDASEGESEREGTTSAALRYTLELQDMSAQISDYMKQLAIVWKMSPKNGDITSYDKESGEFVFGGSVAGYAVNAEATAQKVMASIEQHVYDASIECEGEKISASDSSIKDLYGTIGSFTTKTTSNATRNKNVKLAAAAIMGPCFSRARSSPLIRRSVSVPRRRAMVQPARIITARSCRRSAAVSARFPRPSIMPSSVRASRRPIVVPIPLHRPMSHRVPMQRFPTRVRIISSSTTRITPSVFVHGTRIRPVLFRSMVFVCFRRARAGSLSARRPQTFRCRHRRSSPRRRARSLQVRPVPSGRRIR